MMTTTPQNKTLVALLATEAQLWFTATDHKQLHELYENRFDLTDADLTDKQIAVLERGRSMMFTEAYMNVDLTIMAKIRSMARIYMGIKQ